MAQEWNKMDLVGRISSALINQSIQMDDYQGAAEFVDYIQPCIENYLIMLNLQLLGHIDMTKNILSQFFSKKVTKKTFFSLIHVLKSHSNSDRRVVIKRRIVEFLSLDHFSGSDFEQSVVGFFLFLSQDENKDYCSSYRLLCRYIALVDSR